MTCFAALFLRWMEDGYDRARTLWFHGLRGKVDNTRIPPLQIYINACVATDQLAFIKIVNRIHPVHIPAFRYDDVDSPELRKCTFSNNQPRPTFIELAKTSA
jgi:hypothetical protein